LNKISRESKRNSKATEVTSWDYYWINKERVSKYVPRLKTAFCRNTKEGVKITEIEKISFECFPEYKGDIRPLFLFYIGKK